MVAIIRRNDETLKVGSTEAGALVRTNTPYHNIWYRINIAEDGLYKTSLVVKGDALDYYSTGIRGIALFDKNSNKQFGIMMGMQLSDDYSALDDSFKEEVVVYLHKGTYLLAIINHYDTKHPYAIGINKETAEVSPDHEPNDSAKTANVFTLGRKAEGWLGGLREDASYDKQDWYRINIAAPTTRIFKLRVEGGYKNGGSLTVYDGTGSIIDTGYTEYNALEDVEKLELSVEFTVPGTYLLKVGEGIDNDIPVQYILTEMAGTAVTNNTGVPVILAETYPMGTIIRLPALTSGKGYRVYRSLTPSAEGEVISKCATGTAFADVNVEPGKTYYYAVKEVLKDGTLGAVSDRILADTADELIGGDIKGDKNFILMTIDAPMMSVGGELREIDPGRGTVPTIIDGRTLVPIRAIAEAMGGTVGWNNATRTVTIECMGRNVEMTINSKTMLVNGTVQQMDIAAQLVNGRTVLPVRFVSEAVGCEIQWIGSTRQVVIVYEL
jgi:hypothetical protein